MATGTDEIKYFDTSLLETDFSKWSLNNATVGSDNVSIAVNGSISIELTDVNVIKASKYVRIITEAEGDISDVSNYNSGNNFKLIEVYSTNNVAKKNMHMYNITPYTATKSGNIYTDTKDLTMSGYNGTKWTFSITNKGTKELKIYSIKMYRSQDIDTAQLYDTQQKVNNVYGLVIPVVEADPTNLQEGQVWIRGDLWVSK